MQEQGTFSKNTKNKTIVRQFGARRFPVYKFGSKSGVPTMVSYLLNVDYIGLA